MEHRLDGEHGPEQRRRRADPAAPLQVVQIVHSEPVADVPLGPLGKVQNLLQSFPLFLLLGAEPDEQTLSHGGAEAVHHPDLPLREVLLQLPSRNDGGLVGGGKGGGEAQAQNVLPRLQNGPHGGVELPHVDGGGHRHGPGADLGVKLLETDLAAVQQVPVAPALQLQPQGQHLQLQLRRQLCGEVAAAVGHHHKVGHTQSRSFSFFPLAAGSFSRRRATQRLLATPAA